MSLTICKWLAERDLRKTLRCATIWKSKAVSIDMTCIFRFASGSCCVSPPPHSVGQEMTDGLSVNVRLSLFIFSVITTDRRNFYSPVIWTLRLVFRVHGFLPLPWCTPLRSGNTPHCVALFRLWGALRLFQQCGSMTNFQVQAKISLLSLLFIDICFSSCWLKYIEVHRLHMTAELCRGPHAAWSSLRCHQPYIHQCVPKLYS